MSDSPAEVPPPPKKSSWIGPVLKYGLASGMLAFVVGMNWSALLKLFSQTPEWGPFAIAASIYLVILGMQYIRWWVLVRSLDLQFTLRDAVRLGMVGTFYNTFLPGAVGGDIVKAVFIARGEPTRKAAAVSTVVADRLLGLFGLLLYASAVGGFCWVIGNEKIEANAKLQRFIVVCAFLAGMMVVGFVGLGFLPERRKKRFAERLLKLPKWGKTLAELWETAVQFRARPKAILLGVFLSAISHTAMLIAFDQAVKIFPPEKTELLGTAPEHFVIAPIGFIAQALAPVPGGLGAGEISFGYLYTIIRGGTPDMDEATRKIADEEAAAVGLAGRLSLRVVEWFLGLMGYIVFLTMKTEIKKDGEAEPTL